MLIPFTNGAASGEAPGGRRPAARAEALTQALTTKASGLAGISLSKDGQELPESWPFPCSRPTPAQTSSLGCPGAEAVAPAPCYGFASLLTVTSGLESISMRVVVLLLLAAVLAGVANASTASVSPDGNATYRAVLGETNAVVASVEGDLLIVEDVGASITAGEGCVSVTLHEVTCDQQLPGRSPFDGRLPKGQGRHLYRHQRRRLGGSGRRAQTR